MKTYRIFLPKTFPSTHVSAGEPTDFEAKFKNALMCESCQKVSKGLCRINCWVGNLKRHTIRPNYDLWAKRFKEIDSGDAALSIRQWVHWSRGKAPCQREISRLTREDGIGLQRLDFVPGEFSTVWIERGNRSLSCPLYALANNDGLLLSEWREWFKGYDLSKPMAIIHFTKFRY